MPLVRTLGSDALTDVELRASGTAALRDRCAEVDRRAFGVPPAEVGAMDLQQRLLLELSWRGVAWRGGEACDVDG